MIKNNLIISLRFLFKNKRFAIINIVGLTLGFASFLVMLFFVNHQFSFDNFHSNKDQVYRVNFSFQDNAGNLTTLANSPPALASGVQGKFPELNKISRMRYASNCIMSNGDISFYENHGYYADSLFLEILKYNLSSGDPQTVLDYPNSIVITEDLALKYFNNPSPIGATLMLNNSVPLKVTGIFSPIPMNSHLNFNFLISFPTYIVPDGYASDLTSWSWLGFLTYAELKQNADPKLFEKNLVQHFKDLDPEDPTPMIPVVQSLSDIYLGSSAMTDDVGSNIRAGNRFNVNVLSLVAILILLVAGFNFSNLTNALSINRSKATGIRKVLGADKKDIIVQLLTESFMITFLCMLLSVGITMVVFPSISQFMGWEFNPGFTEIMKLTPVMLVSGVLIGLSSGLYPAFTLAELNIVNSIKGSLKIGIRSPFQLKNMLVMIQFAISIGLISATIVMTKQINYLSNKDIGYNDENVVLIKMLPEDMARYSEVFKEQLKRDASVVNVSQSDRVIGDPWPWSIIQRVDEGPEKSKRVFFNQVDYDFFETMGIPISNGRSFTKEFANDQSQSIVINQKAAEYLELDNPIGKQVHFFNSDGPRTIVGVTEDFNYTSLHQEIGPAVAVLPFIDLEYMYVRFAHGNPESHIQLLENTWDKVSENVPLAWQFLDNDLDRLYQSDQRLSVLIKVFSFLAIILACSGLYGIVAFIINGRIKEFGIRKVLGASVGSIYTMFVRKYIYQMLLAMIIISPIIHYLLNSWLENFAYHININWVVYPIATIAMIIMTLATITFLTLKAARENPTVLLRHK